VLLGRIGGFSDEEIKVWLATEGWDLEVAIEVFRQITLPAARDDHEKKRQNRTLECQQKDRMLAAASYSRHQNHRVSISILFDRINAKYRGENPSAIRLAYLLRDNDFDLDIAFEKHEERRTAVADLAEVDRAERRLNISAPNATEPNQANQDKRIRDFLEIAGTDDWVSAKAFLKTQNWKMGPAVDVWMQGGFPQTTFTPDDGINRKGFRLPQEPHVETDNMWPAGRPLFTMAPPDVSDLADARFDYGALANPNQTCWYVNIDLEPAHPGMSRPDKLEQLYISRGKGTFNNLNTPVIEAGLPIGEPNWYSGEHVKAVNKAYSQNAHRKGGVKKQDMPIPYAAGESNWIYSWHQGRVAQYQVANPGFALGAGQSWKDVVDFSASELDRDFNVQFKGSVGVAGFTGTHPGRDKESLKVKRCRIKSLCDDFGFKYSPSHS
jgi:hypothetical protein